ncbi:MAG: Ig-like domain-containing protein, partial [Bacteroidia bacterium]|nr:Ig-like domain-containing protein [Bacteroidia bacterium]
EFVVTSVSIEQSDQTLSPKSSLDLTVIISPSNATNKDIEWSTSNASIATVSANGRVTAVSGGPVTITATSGDGIHSDTILLDVEYSIGDRGPEGGYIIFDKGSKDTSTRKWDSGTNQFVNDASHTTDTTWRYIEAASADLIQSHSFALYNEDETTTNDDSLKNTPILGAIVGLHTYVGAHEENTDRIVAAVNSRETEIASTYELVNPKINSADVACRD